MEYLKPHAIRNTFKAYERLKREQHIDTLFHKGKAFSVFPIKALHQLVPRGEETSPVRVALSVPKKRHRLSVKRHRVRRLMAEAWRLNKHAVYSAIPADMQLHLFLIFTSGEIPPYTEVEATMIKVGEKLVQLYSTPDA